MNRLNDFLISLSLDPKKREQFDLDPDAVLDQTTLSEEEKDLVKSRNVSKIRMATFQRSVGSLIVVGTGISLAVQITKEAENAPYCSGLITSYFSEAYLEQYGEHEFQAIPGES